MGSRKHKEKDRERKKHRRSRSRSRSREKEHRKEKHSSRHKTHREKRKKLEENRHEEVCLSDDGDEVQIIKDDPQPEKDDDTPLISGEPFKGSGESLSISDTNRLRAKLGLKPLATEEPAIPGLDDEATEGTASATIEQKEIFVKTENIAQTLEIEKLREKVAVMREKRKLNQKIGSVKTLGESDSDDDNVISWVEKSRQQEQEKAKAAQTAKLLDEMDQEFGIGALVEEEFDPKSVYVSKDLKGLTIGHGQNTFKEGQTIILTLKDQGVLDTENDVLENVNMIDDEKAEKNVFNKKQKTDYLPYDEPEYDELGIVKKKNMLSKYDETIEGAKKETFKIGDSKFNKEKEMQLISLKLKQQQNISLQLPTMTLARDYYTPEEMTSFKKPKKKRKIRKRETFSADDLLQMGAASQTGTDHGSRKRKTEKQTEEGGISDGKVKEEPMDDDIEIDNSQAGDIEILGPEDLTGVAIEDDKAELDLELALSRARKLKQQEGKIGNVEKIAKSVLIKEEAPTSQDGGNIVMNSVAEFCRTLGEIPTYGMSGNREDDEDMMDFEQELNEDNQNEEMGRGAWNEVDIDNTPVEIKSRENQPILEEEPDVSTGLAGALKLAMKKGYLDQKTSKLVNLTKHSNLEAQSYTIEEKFYEDDKFGRRDRYTGPIQDFREKDSYKPEVKLEYIDDGGRLLNAKEAFRYLSHKFHGKGPGKNKVDKRTKKLDQEGKLKQMSSTDTPLNTLKLLQEKQRDLQTPFILLSGGSKALTGNSIIKSSK